MPSLEDLAHQYFDSLNPLAKKFSHDIENLKRRHTNWEALSLDEQNKLIDDCIIDNTAKEKYAEVETASCVSSFPRYKLQTGQKIIVDADNDTITFKDEHSAPFTYATQAQLDFSLSGNGHQKSPGKWKQSKTNVPDKENNTEKKDSAVSQPSKGIWNSPFLKGKLGHINSAYSGTASEDESSPQPDVFKTFGVVLTTSDNSSASALSGESSTDETSLINSSKRSGNNEMHNGMKSPFEIWKDFESESIKGNSVVTKRSKSESEEDLLADFSPELSSVSGNAENSATAGVSSETTPLSVAVLDISSDSKFISTLSSCSGVNGESFLDWPNQNVGDLTPDLTFELDESASKFEEDHPETLTVSKSGFDFLDNW